MAAKPTYGDALASLVRTLTYAGGDRETVRAAALAAEDPGEFSALDLACDAADRARKVLHNAAPDSDRRTAELVAATCERVRRACPRQLTPEATCYLGLLEVL